MIPDILLELLTGSDAQNGEKAMAAVLKMKKVEVTEIRRAGA